LGTVKPVVAFRHLDDSGSCSAGPLPYVAWGDSQIGQVIYWSCEMFIVRLILWKRLPQWRQCNLDVAQWVFKYKRAQLKRNNQLSCTNANDTLKGFKFRRCELFNKGGTHFG